MEPTENKAEQANVTEQPKEEPKKNIWSPFSSMVKNILVLVSRRFHGLIVQVNFVVGRADAEPDVRFTKSEDGTVHFFTVYGVKDWATLKPALINGVARFEKQVLLGQKGKPKDEQITRATKAVNAVEQSPAFVGIPELLLHAVRAAKKVRESKPKPSITIRLDGELVPAGPIIVTNNITILTQWFDFAAMLKADLYYGPDKTEVKVASIEQLTELVKLTAPKPADSEPLTTEEQEMADALRDTLKSDSDTNPITLPLEQAA